MIATSAPTPGTAHQPPAGRILADERQHRPVQDLVLGPQRLAGTQHRLDHPLQHRLARDQLTDPSREPALAHLAELEAEPAQDGRGC